MNVHVKIRTDDALSAVWTIDQEVEMFVGNAIVIDLELRDYDGTLYNTPSGTVQMSVFALDEGNNAGAQIGPLFLATELLLDGAHPDGRYRAVVDTSLNGYIAGAYVARAAVAFGSMDVIQEYPFKLLDLSPLVV